MAPTTRNSPDARHRPAPPSPEAMFRALADPTRLRILRLLAPGELCVCYLVDILGVPQPTASRHLAYLRRAGLVRARRAAQWMHYRLAPPTSRLHRKLLDCLDCCGEELPQFADDARRRREVLKCCR